MKEKANIGLACCLLPFVYKYHIYEMKNNVTSEWFFVCLPPCDSEELMPNLVCYFTEGSQHATPLGHEYVTYTRKTRGTFDLQIKRFTEFLIYIVRG